MVIVVSVIEFHSFNGWIGGIFIEETLHELGGDHVFTVIYLMIGAEAVQTAYLLVDEHVIGVALLDSIPYPFGLIRSVYALCVWEHLGWVFVYMVSALYTTKMGPESSDCQRVGLLGTVCKVGVDEG